MKKRATLLLAVMLLSGCSSNVNNDTIETTEITTTETTFIQNTSDSTSISGEALKDGTYDISVDSSSSMFNIINCQLTVKSGNMSAVMTMSGKGYLYLFMGKGENAGTDKSHFIPFVENANGEHTFTIPVEALDKAVDCAAFSKKKEKWYDRTLIFRSDTLPNDAFKDERTKGNSIETLALADGEYTVGVSVSGGSGRASVQSPAKVTISNGQAMAEIIWSSSAYDYMMVNGERFEPTNSNGNSTFIIPVAAFDTDLAVSADTTAMSTPHEIEYTLHFDSATIKQ